MSSAFSSPGLLSFCSLCPECPLPLLYLTDSYLCPMPKCMPGPLRVARTSPQPGRSNSPLPTHTPRGRALPLLWSVAPGVHPHPQGGTIPPLHCLWDLYSSTGTCCDEILFICLSLSWAQSSSEGRGEDTVISHPQSRHGAWHGGNAHEACIKALSCHPRPVRHCAPGGQGLRTCTEPNQDNYKATAENLGTHGQPARARAARRLIPDQGSGRCE